MNDTRPAKTSFMQSTTSGSDGRPANGSNGQTNGRTFNASFTRPGGAPAIPGSPGTKGIDHAEAARKLKLEYARGRKEHGARGLESIHDLLMDLMMNEKPFDSILKDLVKSIYTEFSIKDVSICTKDDDGLFRYKVQHGLRQEVWDAHRSLAYTLEEALDSQVYKSTEISKYTRLYLAEDDPYSDAEKKTCIDHLKDSSRRKSPEDSIEGDYVDVFIHGPRDEILGWIEVSGTWDNRLPDVKTIRSLEVLSSVLALAVVRKQRPSPPL